MGCGVIFAEGIRKETRKWHRCYICGGGIDIGSRCGYQTNDGGDEGDFGTAYWHIECYENHGGHPVDA